VNLSSRETITSRGGRRIYCRKVSAVEDYEAMRRNPAPLPYLQQALAIAEFDPGIYEVVETFSGTATEP
jgi:hypothetical protein